MWYEDIDSIIRVALYTVLIIFFIFIYLATLNTLLGAKVSERKVTIILIVVLALAFLGSSVSFNLLGSSCKTESLTDFLLFRSLTRCLSSLSLAYALIAAIVTFTIWRGTPVLYRYIILGKNRKWRSND